MTSKVVRLVGDDSAIARVVSEASKLIPPRGREDWAQRLVGLARMRAEVMRRMAQPEVQTGQARARLMSAPSETRSSGATWWWIVYALAIVCAFAGSAILLPPKSRGDQDPVQMMAVALPCTLVGAAIILLLALLPLPRLVKGSASAIGMAVIAVIFAVFAGVLNVVRWDGLTEVVGEEPVAVWSAAALALIVSCVVLILRVRGAEPAPRTSIRPSNAGVVEARRIAQRLARESPYNAARPGEVEREWMHALDGLAPDLDASVRDQARELGPYAYTVWAYYDGELELPRVETLGKRQSSR